LVANLGLANHLKVPSELFGGRSSFGVSTTTTFFDPKATRPSLEDDKICGEYQLGAGGNVVFIFPRYKFP